MHLLSNSTDDDEDHLLGNLRWSIQPPEAAASCRGNVGQLLLLGCGCLHSSRTHFRFCSSLLSSLSLRPCTTSHLPCFTVQLPNNASEYLIIKHRLFRGLHWFCSEKGR